jgi:hypothetical protein
LADGIPDEGTLIYVKAGIHGDEPEDISIYAKTNEAFPHDSTGDMFFTESQIRELSPTWLAYWHGGIRQRVHSDSDERARLIT